MKSKLRIPLLGALAAGTLLTGCPKKEEPKATAPQPEAATATAKSAPPAYNTVTREAFNQAASHLNIPTFWVADANQNGTLDPDELATLSFFRGGKTGPFVQDGAFTPAFEAAYRDIEAEAKNPRAHADPRLALATQDLDGGRITVMRTNLKTLPEKERAFARKMLEVGDRIDQLYASQTGIDVMSQQLPAGDSISTRLFWRNWGPQCVGPKTESNPACSSLPGAPKRVVGIYPAELQSDPKFCDKLAKEPNSAELMGHFSAVRKEGEKLVAVPYSQAWPKPMKAIAAELWDAAKLLDASEQPLITYLNAAAESFLSNDWRPADEAWAKMNAQNSKWYVRAAPDEVYWEPCNWKASFHFDFARINPDSIAWQQKLLPFRQEMETNLAKLIGAPYKARKVSFQLPDFIDVVLNAGDSRAPIGATIGESLPNWGPVAEQGRGRTVAMTNFYLDPDSVAQRRAQAESLLTKETMAYIIDDPRPGVTATVLHEAAHNLGPTSALKVNGKESEAVFGGPLASTLEELKAQTASIWYVDYLAKKKVLTSEEARQIYAYDFVWCFGHISRGMYDSAGKAKPYSQLAAIQVGFLMKQGVLKWDPEALAANGTDKGAFTLDVEKMPAAANALMKVVGQIKAKGDKPGAEALVKAYVDSELVPQKVIAERLLRSPKVNFVYAVDL